ncbi:glucans biosynthesis glucosyltransferase MdoH [Sphingomonas sp. H39-1-10]|uniref:glucans biosynthesis glucosyltransferase MdoH n=1 Tax=Sphingomonas pollutisoli TaxID=3030829 RepID=UPI0023B8C7D0|nr:glucans biosynthesis glucosyltransferase MdoH [Sphingomonas pollutisoli]MDF0488656.1 glucans biosynthesis glucosyltransferase MdoH [Sphingomonas pollutisoli]
MIAPFEEYLRHVVIQAPRRRRVESWDALAATLDADEAPPLQPPPRRQSLAAPRLDLSWKHNVRAAFGSGPAVEQPGWQRVVEYRQRVCLVLTIAMTAGILFLSDIMLRAQQMPPVTHQLYLAVYGVMTFFLAANFFKMMLGTWYMLRGAKGNPWHPAHTACDPPEDARVAIVFPVYHEDVPRVAAGIAATWQSIARRHPDLAGHFDTFLLSDSRDPAYRIAEEAAIHALRESFPHGRFFYRWRPSNRNAKLGNIGDFCRRWGGDYTYMLVMDADSVMDGDAIVALLRMMAGKPRLGILQTNPRPILRTSLFGRMQQFGARLYGSVFSYGLQAMYMGNASYIGHNAMIRMAPFVRHCLLPELSGPKPWGGKPLSHDIVESAMIVRAGYEVWFLADMDGSYEEMPANILAFLIRERRWMQGNLQHLRFVFLNGLRSIHRETFINGSMGYLSAPLWAAFLVISAYGMINFLQHGLLAIGSLRSIEMPMLMLLISSLVFLFLPRLIAIGVNVASGRARTFGGKDKLIWSVALETLFSFFFSPLMMAFISRFLWLWVKRKGINWDTQSRGDEPLLWHDCVRYFGWVSVLGAACLALMAWQLATVPWTQQVLLSAVSGGLIEPLDLVLWYSPILLGFTFSVWIARVTSRTFPLLAARKLFSIPEEIDVPQVVTALQRYETRFRAVLPDPRAGETVAAAVRDPDFYVRHRRETRARARPPERLLAKIARAERLERAEVNLALSDRASFDALHRSGARSIS